MNKKEIESRIFCQDCGRVIYTKFGNYIDYLFYVLCPSCDKKKD